MSKKTSLPNVPKSADRDTTVFLQAIKKAVEGMSSAEKARLSDATKNFTIGLTKKLREDFIEQLEEETSIGSLLEKLADSITESQLSKDLGERVELITVTETALRQEIESRIAEMLAINQRISEEVTQRQSAFNELTQIISIVLAATDENRASIVDEVNARTSVTDAHASRLNALDAKTDTANAHIGTLQTATANNQEAIANSKTELRSEFQQADAINAGEIIKTNAAINQEAITRSNADSSLSSRITTAQATANGNTSSIQTHSWAIAGINNQLNATWTVRADVNGLVGGIGLGNNGTTVDFFIRANRFALQGPSGSKSVPFIAYPEGTYIDDEYIKPGVYITDAYIRNAAVDTLQIRKQAVSVISSVNQIVNTGSSPIWSHQTEAAYLNSGGANVLIRLTLFGFDTKGAVTVKVYRNNVSQFTIPFSKNGWNMDSLTESIEVMIGGSYTNSSYHAVISSAGEGFVLTMLTFTATSLKR